MARRKSLASRLYSAHLKRQQAKDRERRLAEREARAEAARIEREAAAEERNRAREAKRFAVQQQQAAERERRRLAAEAARERRRLQVEARREVDRAHGDQERKVAQIERDSDRREAERARKRAQVTVQQRRAEAAQLDLAIQARIDELQTLLTARNALTLDLRTLDNAFEEGGPPAFEIAVHEALAMSRYPLGLRGGLRIAYHPDARELYLDCELPARDVVPTATGYRYVQTTNETRPIPRKEAATNTLYRELIARLGLRMLAEAFEVTPSALVDSVIFNGHVSAKDRATGRAIRPCLISVIATRELIDALVLDEPALDPVLCMAHLNAIVSPHPYDLTPVRPVVEFDLSRYKFIEEIDIVAGLDSRPNPLDFTPSEFEQFVRALFEAMGMKAWITQASRDDGVDAVATNEDPITGGLCVIQAKRYKDVVGLESVYALLGAMQDHNATKGILVTTSWYGKASLDLAARNGARLQLIDGRGLKALTHDHLHKDILLGLPKLPPRWHPNDLT